MRLWAVLVAVGLAAACGGSRPTAPSSLSPGPSLNLTNGSYRLVLTMSNTGEPVCTGPFCSSTSLCSQISGAPLVAVAAPTTLALQRTGDSLVFTAADTAATFRMELQLANGTLSGTASGRFSTGGVTVDVDGGTTGSQAVVTGTIQPRAVAGRLNGSIRIGGSGCSNNGHTWTLTPM